MTQAITLALSKGRIFNETLPLLKAAGVVLREEDYKSRKLYMPTSEANLNILILRATDVPTFVEHGAADLGVVGKDVLMEHGGADLYEPLDLRVACCRLMVAQPVNYQPGAGRIKVATKYINIAKQYFARKGQQVDVIKLYGSMELAPVVGLADKIVDVVDTGGTLKANGLEPTELIAEISSRLVVNKAAMKLKHTAIQALIDRLALAVRS